MTIGAHHREVALNRHRASKENVVLGRHQIGMQHPVLGRDFLVDIGIVDSRADDEELAGNIHAVPKSLEDFSLGGVFDRERRRDGGFQ